MIQTSQLSLLDQLRIVRDQRLTGQVSVFGKDARRPRFAKILVVRGQIAAILHLTLPRVFPLEELLSLNISKIFFEPKERVEVKRDTPILNIADVIAQLESSLPVGKTLSVTELEDGATQILSVIYGAEAQSHVKRASKRYSPQNSPTEFIVACQDIASQMVGGVMATEMFDPIWTKIRNA